MQGEATEGLSDGATEGKKGQSTNRHEWKRIERMKSLIRVDSGRFVDNSVTSDAPAGYPRSSAGKEIRRGSVFSVPKASWTAFLASGSLVLSPLRYWP